MSFYKNYVPIKTNPWLALQESKKHFREQASEQLELVDQLVSEEDQILSESINKTVVGASGRIYKFEKIANSTDLTVTYKGISEDGESYLDTVTDVISAFFSGTGLNNINSTLPNIGIGIAAILSDISNGEGFNTTMANICNAFQGANELSYSDIFSVFNEKSNILKEDKLNLLDMVKSIIKKGRVNSYSWITLLSKLLSTTKESVDEDELLLDKTKPFIIQSMVAYALLEVTPVLIGTICLAISKSIGAILYILTSIVSSIFSAFTRAALASTTVQVDDESLTDYVKGPLIYSSTPYSSYHSYGNRVFNSNITYDDGFLFIPIGPIHLYQWKGENVESPIYMNGFWNIGWDWRKVLLKLSSSEFYTTYHEETSGGITYTRLIFNISRSDWAEFYRNENYYLSADKVKELLIDPDKVMYELYFSMLVWLFLANFMPDNAGNFLALSCESHFSNNYDYFRSVGLSKVSSTISPLSVFSRGVTSNVGNVLYTLVNLPSSVVREDFLYDLGVQNDNMYDVFTSHHNSSVLASLLQDVYTNIVSVRASMKLAPVVTNDIVETLLGADGYNYDCAFSYTSAYSSISIPPYFYSNVITSGQNSPDGVICYAVDSLPIDRGLEIPSTSSEKIIAAVTLVATIAAAVIAVTLTAKRALKLRALSRKTVRATNLNNLKQIYSEDPMDDNKRNLYLKEVRKYNLKASLFGWGTYDPANGWFNDSIASTDSTTAAILLGTNGDMLSNLMKDTSLSISGGDGITPAITLSHLSDENLQSADKIDIVIKAIK